MSCGGRVYKGDTVTISVPFDVSGYTNLTITYSTTGDSKIVKTQEEVTVEDGFITYTFSGHELDLLPDGVIYYTIDCEVEGEDYVDSTNTPLYLATPAGYSGLTADEIYQQGYEDGLEHCSGYTPCDCTSAVTEAYAQGYAQGRADCPECSGSTCNIQPKTINLESGDTGNWFVEPDDGYDGLSELTVKDDGYGQMKYDSGYTQGYGTGQADQKGKLSREYFYQNGVYTSEDGWSSVTVNVPLSSITITENGYYIKALGGYDKVFVHVPQDSDCSSAITEAYQEGYQSGVTHQKQMLVSTAFTQNGEYTRENGWSSVTVNVPNAANLQERTYALSHMDVFPVTIYPISGYDGMSKLTLNDGDYREYVYQSGYSAGLADASGATLKADVFSINASWQGDTTFYPSRVNADGFSRFRIYDNGYANHWRQIGREEGFSSGYTSGSTDGFASGYDSGSTDGFANGYQSGATDGWHNGYDSGYSDGFAQGQADCPECDCTSAYTQGYNDGLVACSSSGTGPGNINTLLVLFSGATRIETYPNGRPLICSGYSLIQPCDNPPCEVDELNPLGEGSNTVSIGMSGTWPVPNLNLQKNGFSIGVSTEDLANWNNNWTVLGVVFNGDIFTQAQGEYVEGGIELVPSSVTTSPYDEDFTLVNISFQ